MILNLSSFVLRERPFWQELERLLGKLEQRADYRMDLVQVRRLYYLYRRAAADLGQLRSVAGEESLSTYLEGLVARAYGEIHETREKPYRFRPLHWFFVTFPQTFRRRSGAFAASSALMLFGALLGVIFLLADSSVKETLVPFAGLAGDPSERVAQEESRTSDEGAGYSTFAAMLMTNNIKVSVFALALGITCGLGTAILLLYNGVILGIVAMDYLRAGEHVFLAGWLLPHGAVEIPAILLGGQAGLVLGMALVGWGTPHSFQERLRQIVPDILTLFLGVVLLLVWAGIVESFLSQSHGPHLYQFKILFGLAELTLLTVFLVFSGRVRQPKEAA